MQTRKATTVNRQLLKTMLLSLNRTSNTLFQQPLPTSILNRICSIDIETLLHAVIYSDIDRVKEILKLNPALLLQCADIEDPAGNRIQRVTPLECALGTGDYKIIVLIGHYFNHLDAGEQHQLQQYKPFQPLLEALHTGQSKPDFDFDALSETIQMASLDDIQTALHTPMHDNNNQSPLHKQLNTFKQHLSPRIIMHGLHFNYSNLEKALMIYQSELDPTAHTHIHHRRADLFWEHIIAPLYRQLPICDQNAYAKRIDFQMNTNKHHQLSFSLKFRKQDIPSRSISVFYRTFDCNVATTTTNQWRGSQIQIEYQAFSALLARKTKAILQHFQTIESKRNTLCCLPSCITC